MASGTVLAPSSLLELPVEILGLILTEAFRGLGSFDEALLTRLAVENSCRALRQASIAVRRGSLSLINLQGLIRQPTPADVFARFAQLLDGPARTQRFADLFLVKAPWRLHGFTGFYSNENPDGEFEARLLELFLEVKHGAARASSPIRRILRSSTV